MKVLGYGEDALTLWALKNMLGNILNQLGDQSNPDDCRIFFRPSFGRGGGNGKSEFGEFDFILLSKVRLYLGESKWNRSSQTKQRLIKLAPEQELRHLVFQFYVKEWFGSNCSSWAEFREKVGKGFEFGVVRKPQVNAIRGKL